MSDWKTEVIRKENESCSYCKKANTKIIAKCNANHISWGFLAGFRLCSSCCKKCKDCGKYFCPKHIDKHKCR